MNDQTPQPCIDASWRRVLAAEFDATYMDELRALLDHERAAGVTLYPPMPLVFNAFARTRFEDVRAVIVGQDPYHGAGQAMGLSFSVPRGVPKPPSLRNLLAEVASDLDMSVPEHGDLTAWADQGVLLLNSTLTVRAGEAASHAGRGWERFTDAAIDALVDKRDGIVFLLWGRHARAKRDRIDETRHLVLTAAHPSPLSATKGFFGCRHFSQANAWLQARGQAPIDWSLPD